MPVDIMTMSTIDIQQQALATANMGFVPSDLLKGSINVMLNREMNDMNTASLKVTSRFKEVKIDPDFSEAELKYSNRAYGRSQIKETANPFVANSTIDLPQHPMVKPLQVIGKLIAYAQSNGEDTSEVTTYIEDTLDIKGQFKKFIPATDPSRSKPWLLEDAPTSRHVNGYFNGQQNIEIGLGNYRSNDNTKDRTIDYDQVAIVLRSLGCLLFIEENWQKSYLRMQDVTLRYNLNLSEFPKVNTRNFLTIAVKAFIFKNVADMRAKRHQLINLLSEREVLMRTNRLAGYKANVITKSEHISVAMKEVAQEQISRTLFKSVPLHQSELKSDILSGYATYDYSLHTATSRNEIIPRAHKNLFGRSLTAYIAGYGNTHLWVHEAMLMYKESNYKQMGELINEKLPPKVFTFAYDWALLAQRYPSQVWKQMLKWMTNNVNTYQSMVIESPIQLFNISCTSYPTAICHLYASSYSLALAQVSKPSFRQLMVHSDLDESKSIVQVRQRIYKSIAKFYTLRYQAKVKMYQNLIKQARQNPTKTFQVAKKTQHYKTRLLYYQWRVALYPQMVPIDMTTDAYSTETVKGHIYDAFGRYVEKRREARNAKLLEEAANTVTNIEMVEWVLISYIERMSAFQITKYMNDILRIRKLTIQDIDDYLVYDQELQIRQPKGDDEELNVDDKVIDIVMPDDYAMDDYDIQRETERHADTNATSMTQVAQVPVVTRKHAEVDDGLAMLMSFQPDVNTAQLQKVRWDLELHDMGYNDLTISAVGLRHSILAGALVSESTFNEMTEQATRIKLSAPVMYKDSEAEEQATHDIHS